MPISSSYAPITYAGDGIANAFAVTFPFQLQTDLVVSTVVVATGVTTLLVLGTDYIVTPNLNSPASTGTVTTTVSVPTGTDLVIARSTPVTQLTTWVPNDPNLSTSTMNAVDKLTMEVQEIVQSGGSLPDSALGAGTATTDTFLRGGSPRQWTNTLIGPIGPFTVPADTTALHIVGQNGDAGYKIVSGATSVGSYRFGVDGSSNPWDFEIFYDPTTPGLGFQTYGNTPFATFDNSGNVGFTGTVNATLFTGNADGSLITSGQVLPQFLASNASGNAAQFLNGLGQFAVPAGGGGINTTTTGTFTIAAVASSQTVPVTSVTGIVAGTELLIADGTHAIIGHVTVVSSLNLTFVTDSIQLGIAGNTMASGASVQASAFPGNNTIQVGDTAIPRASYTTIELVGQAADRPTGIATVDLYIDSISGSTVTLAGYGNTFFTIGALHAATSVHDLIAYKPLASAQWTTLGTSTQGAVLHADTTTTLALGKITASDSVTSGTITPVLLNATNSLTNGYVPSYDSGTGHFTWVANGGSIPGGGDAGKFFRGDNTFSNILDLSHDSGAESIGLTLSQGVTNGSFGSTFGTASDGTYSFWIMQKRAAGTWGTPASVYCNYQVGTGIDGGVLSVGAAWTNPDGTNIERIFADKMIRTSQGLRSVYGPLSLIYEISAPSSPLTIDLVNGAYQRISSLGLALTIALADTTPLPTSLRYESELTLELNLSSHDITWPGTITWANGGTAPTIANSGLNATGINIIRLIRRQGQTQWVGFVDNAASAAPYTDAQARSAVLNSTYLLPSSDGSLTWTIVPGTSAKLTITPSSITNAMLVGSIQPSKIQGISGGGSANAYLNQQGNFTTPSGGGTFTPGTSSYVWNNSAGFQTFNGANVFSGALNTFSRTFPSLSSSTASVKMCGLYNQILLADANGVDITVVDNWNNTGSDAGVGAMNIYHTVNAGSIGKASSRHDMVVNASLTGGFTLGHTQITAAKRMNGGVADAVWLNTWGPDSNYSATPDSDGITHEFNTGVLRIGEVNYGNAWGDFGFLADRGAGRVVCGLEFFPDWLVYSGVTGDSIFQKYNVSWAIGIGSAGAGPAGTAPKNWIGLLIAQDGIVGKNDHASIIGGGTTGSTAGGGGYGLQLAGSSSSGNPIGKAINILHAMDVGIDISEATITAEAVSGHSNKPAIQLLSGQAICFKAPTGANTGVYIWFNGTNLVATKDGGNTTATII